jgi:phosphoglycolate phosphatase
MFDLDGTLADTGLDLADAVNFTRAHFALASLPNSVIYANVGRGVDHLIKQSLPDDAQAHFTEARRVFLERYETHLLDHTVLYPGVPEVLDYFRPKRRLVVSNKIHRLTEAVVRGLGIADEFDAIFGGDSVAEKKPHPALLRLALAKFDVTASRAVIIGDGDTDIEAGKRAGVVTCGVTYGLGNKQDILAAEPDLVINDIRELPEYFC